MAAILKKQGIRISPPLPSYDTSQTLRFAPFNDLDIIGASATGLDITGIDSIHVYYSQASNAEKYVVGMDVFYKLSDGKVGPCILHGAKTNDVQSLHVTAEERIIGAFVGTNPSDVDHIRALRFVKTNVTTGDVSTEPPESLDIGKSAQYSAVHGNIVAFHGITLRGVPDDKTKELGGLPGRVYSFGFQTRSGV